MVVSLRACSLMVKLMDKDIGRGQTAILTLVNSSTANGMATVSDGSWVDTANLKCVPTYAPAGNRHESMNITRACVAKRLADKSTQHSSNRHNIFWFFKKIYIPKFWVACCTCCKRHDAVWQWCKVRRRLGFKQQARKEMYVGARRWIRIRWRLLEKQDARPRCNEVCRRIHLPGPVGKQCSMWPRCSHDRWR